MATFVYGEHLLNGGSVVSGKLGATAGTYYTEADLGKPVKLIGDSRWGLCADGDEAEGFITSVEAFTVSNYSFGGIKLAGFKKVIVDGSGVGNAIAIGDYVVAAAGGKVKKGTPATHKWRYVAGAVGSGAALEGVVMRVS